MPVQAEEPMAVFFIPEGFQPDQVRPLPTTPAWKEDHSFRLCQYLVQAASKPNRKSLIPCAIKSPLWVARNAFQPAVNASRNSHWVPVVFTSRIAWVPILPKLLESLGPGLMLRVVSVMV
jgi:hypothetical protein